MYISCVSIDAIMFYSWSVTLSFLSPLLLAEARHTGRYHFSDVHGMYFRQVSLF